ncbi:hypothetical protein HHK36_000592 [Tetracentron sinense]|uniref:Nuclear-pore anchor n=1 Tax=Tetracentron sinense TaxID=13715 RepID=A0A835DR83_TETSI|nr:hypothetical protein HHK36_000592 [Tetracentron sinense]
MPLFLSDEEFRRCSHDASLVAEKADSFIKDLQRQFETLRAQSDAASITAEQTCALLEQKYISLSSDFANLESLNAQTNSALDKSLSDLAEVQAQKHQLHLKAIGKDGDIERLSIEASELHKSKRQLLELLEQKDSEISEKNATIKSYLDKIVNMTDSSALREARLNETEAELTRSRAACTRLSQECFGLCDICPRLYRLAPQMEPGELGWRVPEQSDYLESCLLKQYQVKEKELVERHNVWLNEEITAKVGSIIELRKTHTELEADISSKLADVERQFNECSSSLKWNKERVRELEMKLTSAQEELCSSKDAAAANEERFSAEISTVHLFCVAFELCGLAASAPELYLSVTKLVELYKESSGEWSRKAGELEGVIKALETHLSQVENDYKEKVGKEISARKEFEKEVNDLKEKLEKCEAEIENSRKTDELSLLPLSSFTREAWMCGTETDGIFEDNGRMLVPKIPVGVSGTALAASLLRDGWSLAKMYGKYQETVDALRHEQLGRKQSQAILERVLYEIEEKAEVILDERVSNGFSIEKQNSYSEQLLEYTDASSEHERMVEAYSVMNQKLQHSFSEQVNLENTIQELKADLRRHERDYATAQKEIVDLQKQVTVLLKECRDIQLRCGSIGEVYDDDGTIAPAFEMDEESGAGKVISERLLTFKDINGLVEQNVHLRSLVRSLSDEIESRNEELREKFEMVIQKQTAEAASKVAAVLKRAEEQGRMIESLHSSVAMYKRLYEEELKLRSSNPHSTVSASGDGRKDIMLLLEGSQEATKKSSEQAAERAKSLEEELAKLRSETISLRLEREKSALEANFARERLDSFMREFEHQRDEMNGVLARNVEFSQLIVDYQRRLRESCDSMNASGELSRKSTMEVSILKHEKEMLLNSEKRASDEVRSLSERVYRLQASLDIIQSAEEVREDARAMERKKQEEYIKKVEGLILLDLLTFLFPVSVTAINCLLLSILMGKREWADAKKELQEERDNVRTLTLDREHTIKNAMRQVEEMGKELASALHAVAAAESRAAVAEARCSDLEVNIKSSKNKVAEVEGGVGTSTYPTNEITLDMSNAKEEMEKLREEAQANKDHMLQYKSIAQVNETALKQMESAHEEFKFEADKLKKSLEAELLSLRERIFELESEYMSKSNEVASAVAGKEEALGSALAEISRLKEDSSIKISQIMGMEIQISSLKEDLENEHQRWRTAQNNYERQVILQSETIQELTRTSQALALLQEEASQLRKLADTKTSENDVLKAKWETEKLVLEKSKNEAESKYIEINEQNKILHNRLEALHIKLAEKERNSAGISSANTSLDSQCDGELQNVINYLRRSKEIVSRNRDLFVEAGKAAITITKWCNHKLELFDNKLYKEAMDAVCESMGVQSDVHEEGFNNGEEREKELCVVESKFESALKASETAQELLRAERANSRAVVFTDEEFKSLQLQVREMNLLRESNMQLREENKHNFEECQKLREIAQKARIETQNLDTLLREKNIEVDACKKEIEMQKIEKEHLENRVAELLERCKNIDVEDYDRMKDDFQWMQVKLKEKEAEVEEIKKLVSDKQDIISLLEKDLANIQLELTEREKSLNDSLQVQATLKLDAEKQKKLVVHFKKKFESLSKEKEEMSKEKQTLSRQLEDCRQGKRPIGDGSSEQSMKEKEKEKDTRIQILEKTLEREREDLRKEKAKRAKTENTVLELIKNVNEEKKKLCEDIERYKHERDNLPESINKCLLLDSIDLEFLEKEAKIMHLVSRNPNAIQIIDIYEDESYLHMGSSVSQLTSETVLDDQSTAYRLVVENFEGTVNSTLSDGLGARALHVEASPLVDASSIAAGGPCLSSAIYLLIHYYHLSEDRFLFFSLLFQSLNSSLSFAVRQVPAQVSSNQSSMVTTVSLSPAKTTEERERRSTLHKPNVETRKTGRKLVRPRLGRPEESPGDIEMPEMEGISNSEGKLAASHDTEIQSDLPLPTQLSARKRSASSSASELRDESLIQQETSSEVPAHVLKKLRGSDSPQEGAEGQLAVPPSENLETLPAIEESFDATGDLPQGSNEEVTDVEKDEVDTTKEQTEELKEPPLDGQNHGESQNELNAVSDDILDKTTEIEDVFDDGSKDSDGQDIEQSTMEIGIEMEEGELMPDMMDQEGGDMSVMITSPEPGEGHPEPVTAPGTPPAAIDEEAIVAAATDYVETTSTEVLNDDKNDVDDVNEETTEGSDKSNNGNNQGPMETELSPKAAFGTGESSLTSTTVDSAVPVPKQGSSSAMVDKEEGKEVLPAGRSPTPTTINLTERARQRAMLRQAGLVSPLLNRGRGRAVGGGLKKDSTRGGRGVRGGRSGRGGRSSDDKEQS